ncbi:MAG: hypothetical protein KDA51_00670 [Planctomycetales bacterium]|nr:hypothetical protein [Planctomycetales bacterium]
MVHNPQRPPGRLADPGAVARADRYPVDWYVLWFVSNSPADQIAWRVAVCCSSASRLPLRPRVKGLSLLDLRTVLPIESLHSGRRGLEQ